MDTSWLQAALVWLGTALAVGLGFVVATVLIVLLMMQSLTEAYHSPEPVKFSHRTRLSTVLLLAAFGVGMLLRILQMQGLPLP